MRFLVEVFLIFREIVLSFDKSPYIHVSRGGPKVVRNFARDVIDRHVFHVHTTGKLYT